MIDQRVNLLDDAVELLLLGTQLPFKPIEACYHVIKLSVFSLFLVLVTVEHAELVLELSLDLTWLRTGFILLLTVDSDEIGELGTLLALTDLKDDAHGNILEAVPTIGLPISHCLDVLGHSHHVVAGELAFLLENLVLVNEQFTSERLVLILLNQLFDLLVAQAKKFGVSYAPEVDVHAVLHEKGTMINCRALVELINYEFVRLKLRIGLKDTILNEVKSIYRVFLSQHDRVLLE